MLLLFSLSVCGCHPLLILPHLRRSSFLCISPSSNLLLFIFHSPPLEHEYYEANDYFDISQHEVDRQDELEYEVSIPLPSLSLHHILLLLSGQNPQPPSYINHSSCFNSACKSDSNTLKGDR